MGLRFQHLVLRYLTTTVTAVHDSLRIFYKLSATTLVLTPTNVLTKNAANFTTLTGQNLTAHSLKCNPQQLRPACTYRDLNSELSFTGRRVF
jgi:hypothetical protein